MGVSSTVRIKASRKLCQFGKYVGHKNDRWCPKMCRKVRVFRLTKRSPAANNSSERPRLYDEKERRMSWKLHGSVRETLAELRSRLWVPKGRQSVKRVLSKCVVCKKLEGKACSAPCNAALPEFRVLEAPAFFNIGVDFAGPFYVKAQATKMEKVYIALFPFCMTRAIHLELVSRSFYPNFEMVCRETRHTSSDSIR